ncbi:MAG TPA: hypothetical protein VGE21_13380, partial [Flavobacteriales bacterium]
MDRRLITVLAVAITLALAGLVVVQAQWIRNSIALKDARFDESVDNALIAVSERLERMEALDGLREHQEARRFLEQFDAPDPATMDTLVMPPWPEVVLDSALGEPFAGDEEPADEHERLLSDVFQG